MELRNQVYQLSGSWDREWSEGGEVVRFDEYYVGMAFDEGAQKYPEVLVMDASLDGLATTDYPDCDMPVFSRRLVDALALDESSVQIVPVRLQTRVKPKAVNDDYVMLQFIKHEVFFDHEYSDYRKEALNRDLDRPPPADVVMRLPEGGFPAIFRLKHAPLSIYINGESKRILDEMGALGIGYNPIDVSTSPRGKRGTPGSFDEHVDVSDRRMVKALAYHVEHESPFSTAELSSMELVMPRRAKGDFDVLRHCTGARILSLRACDVGDISWWPQAPGLFMAELRYTPITDVSELLRTPQVRDVLIDCSLVEDLTPLLALPRLRLLVVRGCPLSPESFYEILPRLKAHVPDGGDEPTTVLHSSEEEWRLTLEIQSRGFWAAYHKSFAQGRIANPAISAPGLIEHNGPGSYSFPIPISPGKLRQVLEKQDLDLKSFILHCEQLSEKYIDGARVT